LHDGNEDMAFWKREKRDDAIIYMDNSRAYVFSPRREWELEKEVVEPNFLIQTE
jgi:hypothetical protein